MMLDKKVKEIMTTDVITTPSNVDVVNAFEELMEHKISAMPVVDDGELVGICLLYTSPSPRDTR